MLRGEDLFDLNNLFVQFRKFRHILIALPGTSSHISNSLNKNKALHEIINLIMRFLTYLLCILTAFS